MKTSEMIAYLEEHPKAKFEAEQGCLTVWVTDRGFIEMNWCGNTGMSGNMEITRSDYTLVREPVPVWEAVKALTEGKTVECITPNTGRTEFWSEFLMRGISKYQIEKGTWYIKEGEED